MKGLLIFIAMGLAGLNANAQFGDVFSGGGLGGSWKYAEHLRSMSNQNQRSLLNASQWKHQARSEHRRCSRQYQRMFSNGELNITIAFGYMDNEYGSRTSDSGPFQSLILGLTRSCSHSADQSCGFTTVVDRPGLTELARFVNFGGKKQRLRVVITHPSVSSYGSESFRGDRVSRQQRRRSRQSENSFFGGVRGTYKTCDICLYAGHSRNGGGPDFSPVPFSHKHPNGKINYSPYMKAKKGYKRLMSSLRNAKRGGPSLVGMYSCYSDLHFYKRKTCTGRSSCQARSLASFGKRTGTLTTSGITHAGHWPRSLGLVLDGALNFKCKSAWKANLKSNLRFTRGQEWQEWQDDFLLKGNFL